MVGTNMELLVCLVFRGSKRLIWPLHPISVNRRIQPRRLEVHRVVELGFEA